MNIVVIFASPLRKGDAFRTTNSSVTINVKQLQDHILNMFIYDLRHQIQNDCITSAWWPAQSLDTSHELQYINRSCVSGVQYAPEPVLVYDADVQLVHHLPCRWILSNIIDYRPLQFCVQQGI